MNPILAFTAMALLPQCPYFYEFFPDPTDVPDNEGEYIIIKWESPDASWEAITLQLDDDKPRTVEVSPEQKANLSLFLQHPTLSFSLPNSRATRWTLGAGDCRDTAYLPVPKAGKILKKNENGEWTPADAARGGEKCNSSESGNLGCSDLLTLDDILSVYGEIPIYISEFAPCPEEPIPEWFEVSNRSAISFPLNGISDCKTKTPLKSADSLNGKTSVLITKDSAGLREFLGNGEIKIAQISISALKNTADTLRLCVNGLKIDSAMWGKQVNRSIKCPSAEKITAGFVPKVSTEKSKVLKISERVLSRSKRKNSLKIQWHSTVSLDLRIIDRNGVGIIRKKLEAAPSGSGWLEIPQWRSCPNGPCFIHILGEGVNETIPFVVRP